MVEHDSGLYASNAVCGIDFEDPRHVFGKIEDDGDVAALSGERRAAATAEQRRAELAAEGDRGPNIVGVAREYDPNRNLAVVRTIGGIESAGTAVESDFTPDLRAQSFCQSLGVSLCGLCFGDLGFGDLRFGSLGEFG
jgi:hypothetical protein